MQFAAGWVADLVLLLEHDTPTDTEMAVGPKAWKALENPFRKWFVEQEED